MQKALLHQQSSRMSYHGGLSELRAQTHTTYTSYPRSSNCEFLDCLDMVDDVLLTKMIEKLELRSLYTLPDLTQLFRRTRAAQQTANVQRRTIQSHGQNAGEVKM
jgi:hypothetical protein